MGRVLGDLRDEAERGLSFRVAAVLWATAVLTAPLYLLLPHPFALSLPLIWAVTIGGPLVGLWCRRAARRPPAGPVNQVLLLVGIATVAVCIWQLGGSSSPSRIYLISQIVYAATFFRSPVFLVAIVAAHASPLLYDPGAVGDGYLVEVLLAAPTYAAVWLSIAWTKEQLLRLREEARRAALTDVLTGLDNREGFRQHLAPGGSAEGAVLFVDLDAFKQLNDEHGHETGDQALVALADAVRRTTRAGDVAARFGGEELVLWLPGCDEAAAQAIAERLRGTASLFFLERLGLALTMSIGIAIGRAERIAELTRAADHAMYAAKAAGCGRIALAEAGAPVLVG